MRLPDYKLIEDKQTSIDALVVRKVVCRSGDEEADFQEIYYSRGHLTDEEEKDCVKIIIYADELKVTHLGE